jgi:phosphoglycolate phosphatase-like HAD superfamily hydrolase
MIKEISNFQKNKKFLLCSDSDGCVIDGMTVKHKECFGPSLIEEWELEQFQADILTYWNKINLYSMTRGINRFKGLLLALDYINDSNYASIDTTVLKEWVETTNELSKNSLIRELTRKDDEVLKKALSWSELVNKSVENLSAEKKLAFEGVIECFKDASQYADIAVVSSANARAVEEEWGANHILNYVDVVMTQENGSKADCIKQMLSLGYEKQNVLMIGDAPGDISAAKECGVLYYPILVDKEVYSWKKFKATILESFLLNQYEAKWMKLCEKEFVDNLLNSK